MRSSLLTRSGKWLSGHANRLRQTLDLLGRRLRETVATAVGQTVAVAVREAVHVVLTDFSGSAARGYDPVRDPDPSRSLWGRPDDTEPDPWYEGPDPYDTDDVESDPGDVRGQHPTPDQARKPAPRWPLAVVVGCQAAAWWLRRRLAKLPVLAAVAVGVLSALATYAGGPLTAAGIGLAGSALNLAGSASALGAFGSS
jgi:hypothetical protein